LLRVALRGVSGRDRGADVLAFLRQGMNPLFLETGTVFFEGLPHSAGKLLRMVRVPPRHQPRLIELPSFLRARFARLRGASRLGRGLRVEAGPPLRERLRVFLFGGSDLVLLAAGSR